MPKIALFLLTALGFFVSQTSGQQAPAGPIAIVNVDVLPMDRDRVLRGQTVVVENGVITRIAPGDAPPSARRVDGTGKFLIPGLMDLHVHLSYNSEPEQRQLLQLFLAHGVTTVMNLRGTPQVLELRQAIAKGRVLGPRLFTVGPYVNQPFVTTAEEVEQAVVEQKRAGYDFVKLHGDLSREAYARLMNVARREGIRVIGHAPRNLGHEIMFQQRQYAVVHAEEFIYDTANSSKDRDLPQVEARIPSHARNMAQAGIWLMPNLVAFEAIAGQINNLDSMLARPEMRFLPRRVQEGWGPATNPYTARIGKDRYPGIMTRLGILQRISHQFHRAGVRLLLGTDAMNTGTIPGVSAHDEMQLMVDAGLTPYEVLKAATANGAEFLGIGEPSGRIAVGYRADLILLEANPLEPIANTRRIAGVMLRGQWFSQADLAALLEQLRASGN
jgi:imidazolonepropionase-like amidohydrolase